jgi:hypothetical protein
LAAEINHFRAKGDIMRGLVPTECGACRLPRRFLLVALLLVMFTAFSGPLTQSASASKAWCRTDPLISVDGYLTDVFVAGPLDAVLHVTGPTEIVVTVPVGVDAWLVLADLGFGRGTNLTFEESSSLAKTWDGVEIQVAVYVPASDDAMPIRVEVAPRILGLLWPASAEGTANEWIVMRTTV